MKRRILLLMLAAVFAVSSSAFAQRGKGPGGQKHKEMKEAREAFREEQKQENEAFRESLKDMPQEERQEARKAHMEEQDADRKAFHEEAYQKRIEDIQNSDKLTDDQKADRIKDMEDGHAEAQARHEEQKAENEAFIKGLSPELSNEERRAMIKKHMDEQREENRRIMEERREEHKAKREEARKERQE